MMPTWWTVLLELGLEVHMISMSRETHAWGVGNDPKSVTRTCLHSDNLSSGIITFSSSALAVYSIIQCDLSVCSSKKRQKKHTPARARTRTHTHTHTEGNLIWTTIFFIMGATLLLEWLLGWLLHTMNSTSSKLVDGRSAM